MTVTMTFVTDTSQLESQPRKHTNCVSVGLHFLRLKAIICNIRITTSITKEFLGVKHIIETSGLCLIGNLK